MYSSSASASCQRISTNIYYPNWQLKISDSQYFFLGMNSLTYELYYVKATFGNTSTDWVNKISCSMDSAWSLSFSESQLSSDNTKIYSFATYGGTTVGKSIFFITFTLSDGSVSGTRYKSAVLWTAVYGSVLTGNYLITTSYCSGPFIVIFDTVLSSFTVRVFSGSYLYGLAIDKSSGRYFLIFIISI